MQMRRLLSHSFTIAEMIATTAVIVVLVVSILPLTLQTLKMSYAAKVKSELRVQVNTARQWLLRDLQGTSQSSIITLSGTGGTIIAFSAPVYRWTASTSPLNLTDNSIQWTDEAVYYLYTNSTTSQKELRRTAIDHSYYAALSISQRQVLLSQIQAAGSPAGLVPASYIVRAPIVLLKNVTSSRMGFSTSGDNSYDAYAAAPARATMDLGSMILSPGSHALQFKMVGTSSSGYTLGVDSLIAGGAGLPLEAEYYLPPASQNGATAAYQSMISTPVWRNNALVEFPATGSGAYFTLNVYNDTWMESMFTGDAVAMDKTKIAVLAADGDQVVQMDGNKTTWDALSQAGTTAPVNDDDRQNASIRVLITGGDSTTGGAIQCSGRKVKITFSASPTSGPLSILSAYIMERQSEFNGKSGTAKALLFSGSAAVVIAAGGSVASDFADFPIDKSKDYLVSFKVTKAPPGLGIAYYPAAWVPAAGSIMAGQALSAVISGDDSNHAPDADWSGLAGVTTYPKIIGVANLFVTYPDTATYTSGIIDTKVAAPRYQSLRWTGDTPSGTAISVKVRSGNQPNLSDAGAWSSASGGSTAGSETSLSGVSAMRYVQFQATLTSPDPYSQTPSLRDVKVTWPGTSRSVQFSADVAKGPTRGKFIFLVDGQSLQPPWVQLNFTTAKTSQKNTYAETVALTVQSRNP